MDKNKKCYTYSDGVFSYEGCYSVENNSKWSSPWRIDCDKLLLYPNLNDNVADNPSGVRLAFVTNSKRIVVELAEVTTPTRLDVYLNKESVENFVVNRDAPTITICNRMGEMKLVEVWLDQCHKVMIKGVWVDSESIIKKYVDTRKHWIHYGSSISHSIIGRNPSCTWVAQVARKLDVNVTNMGFNGRCLCEPMAAKLIRDNQADVITLKVGINCIDGRLTILTFVPAVIGLIETIREKQKEVPIALISPIICVSDDRGEGVRGKSGYTLEEMRAELRRVVQVLREYGDDNLYYVDGLTIYGKEEVSYLPDGLHPNESGQDILAEHFIQQVFESLPLGV